MIPKSLEKYNLVRPQRPKFRRLVMTGEGDTGCGKSSFALRSMPRPILLIDLDRNLEGIEPDYADDDDILIKHIDIPAQFDKKQKEDQKRDYKLLMEIQDLYEDALATGVFRTVAIDTGNDLWELARRGILGGGLEFGDTKRTDYAPANAYMKAFFDSAKSSEINFYMSLHTKDEYKGATATGKRVAGGWKGSIQCSQCHVRLYKDDSGSVPDKFHAEILKCSANSEVEGTVLDGEEISFRNLGMLIYRSSMEDWA